MSAWHRAPELKRALAARRSLLGIWLSLRSDLVAELAGEAGFDWALIDTEHAPNELSDVLAQMRALESTPCHPVVRVGSNDMVEIKRVLDLGACAIMIPCVQSPEDAARAVAHARYPPEGIRGVAAASRGARFGREPQYFATIHERLSIIAQLESRRAVQCAADIAAVEGIDAVFVGPSDLAADIGLLGQPDHPDVEQLVDVALRHAAGRTVGILARSASQAAHYLSRGASFVAVGSDTGLMVQALQQQLRSARQPQPDGAARSGLHTGG